MDEFEREPMTLADWTVAIMSLGLVVSWGCLIWMVLL